MRLQEKHDESLVRDNFLRKIFLTQDTRIFYYVYFRFRPEIKREPDQDGKNGPRDELTIKTL